MHPSTLSLSSLHSVDQCRAPVRSGFPLAFFSALPGTHPIRCRLPAGGGPAPCQSPPRNHSKDRYAHFETFVPPMYHIFWIINHTFFFPTAANMIWQQRFSDFQCEFVRYFSWSQFTKTETEKESNLSSVVNNTCVFFLFMMHSG